MNVPNILTMSRFVLAGGLLAFLFTDFPYAHTAALACFIVASLSDALDGWLARTRYGVTDLGGLLDPIADKVLVTAAFVAFVQLDLMPAWIVVLILTREFLVTGLRALAASKGKLIVAGRWGKHKTIWQMVMITIVLLGLCLQTDFGDRLPVPPSVFAMHFETVVDWMSWAVAAITLWSGIVYFRENRDVFRT
jgi:CDP-diacylglycerol--glycerol-3-phosphate 3-phosphatidyltransferase